MKAILTISGRGVITLPAKVRRQTGLEASSQVVAQTTPEGLLLRPAVTVPLEMYTDERIKEFDEAEQELDDYLAKQQP